VLLVIRAICFCSAAAAGVVLKVRVNFYSSGGGVIENTGTFDSVVRRP
jgi:hypothetical protein